jgi:hypothetical protein
MQAARTQDFATCARRLEEPRGVARRHLPTGRCPTGSRDCPPRPSSLPPRYRHAGRPAAGQEVAICPPRSSSPGRGTRCRPTRRPAGSRDLPAALVVARPRSGDPDRSQPATAAPPARRPVTYTKHR